MSNAVVLDTETTGLKGEVIELAMIPVDQFGNKKTGSEFESFFKPVGELSYAAMAVNNITPEMLEIAPYFSEVEEGILPEEDTILIGHNISFDVARLGDNWANYRTICTQKLAERLDMKSKGCDTYKNMGLFYFLNGHIEVQIEGDPHTATFDAQVTGFILTKMMDMLDLNTIEEVYEYLNNVPFVCNMPKHRGVLWKDVIDDDPDYVEWILDNRKLRSEEDHKKLEELFNEW